MKSQVKRHRATDPRPEFRLWLAAPLILTVTLLWHCSGAAASLVIDDFAYTNSSAARSAWVNTSAPPVNMITGGEWGPDQVMVLTCDFATRSSRCIWDRSISLDLSAHAGFELQVFVPDPGPISSFTLYFRSGQGWYAGWASLAQPGWQTLRLAKSDFAIEGTPTGWDQIDGIRLSPWKATPQNTYLALRKLSAVTPTVLLVRDTQTGNPEVVQQTIDRHRAWLSGYNVDCGVITRTEVEAGLLQECRLAILPYNESVSETEMAQYESFVANGGKLMVHYLLRSRLASLLGVRVTGWTQGDFAAWRFVDPAIPELPSRVLQDSWNITLAEPNGNFHSRVAAWWEDSLGQNTGRAAWIASDRGFFMSHILLADDADQKSFALLCLIGSILPDVWESAAAGALAAIGRVGPYLEYGEAVTGIHTQGALTLRANLVQASLAAAEANRVTALAEQAAGRYSQAITAARAARTHLKEAYVLCLKPVFPEFRAIWEHHATGPYPGNWSAGAAALASNQFNAIFPNMLWGGLAHYNSAYLPHSAEFAQYGDQVAACVTAAHAHGLQVHVWKVNWNLLGAPQSFIDNLRTANRTQVSRTGEPADWLCPSHPDNLALETNSMLEIVRNYDVDGIHFDYIRYPDDDHCYCGGCAVRFQNDTGRTVANWPADVLSPGALRTAFLDWRRAQITRLVDAVYRHTKALKPHVQVSAAVFPDAQSAYDGVGQDWRLWVTNGILDFVCPMDYTTELHQFTNRVGQQLRDVDGRIPVYPGIGAFILETDGTLAQVQAARAANTDGFIIFELSATSASELLPAMGKGATAPDEPDTDSDGLPDAWEQEWFGNLMSASFDSDFDEDAATDGFEYINGTDPTESTPGSLLEVQSNAGQVEVSFLARGVKQPGYSRAERHYRLESCSSPDPTADWVAVPGYADHSAQPGVVRLTYAFTPNNATSFYRLRVSLQQAP